MKTPEESLEPIVTAVERLSRKKIGALIAIERSTEMAVWTESGVKLDAVISAELLETIFWPATPLHDLGVVIKYGRIVAASCQFPLAETGAVDRSLGSRHRAAVGMSHESDCVVVVVSEETGIVSMAVGGVLRRGLNSAALREELRKELSMSRQESSIEREEESDEVVTAKAEARDGTTEAA